MPLPRRLRGTPTFLLAVTALVVATGGAGYAAGRIGTADIKNGAVTSAKIKDQTIRRVDLDPTTVAALRGATGPAGPAGAPGTNGTNGTNGVDGVDGADGTNGVRAYGTVVGGVLQAGRSSGFDAVTNPANGVYCMTLTDATIDRLTIAPQVSIDFSDSSGIGHIVSVDYRVDSCAPGADFTVNTMSFTGAGFAWASGIAFNVLVP